MLQIDTYAYGNPKLGVARMGPIAPLHQTKNCRKAVLRHKKAPLHQKWGFTKSNVLKLELALRKPQFFACSLDLQTSLDHRSMNRLYDLDRCQHLDQDGTEFHAVER